MRFPLRPFLNCVIAGGLIVAMWPLGQTAYGMWNQRALSAQFRASQSASPQGKTARAKPAQSQGPKSRLKTTSGSSVSPTLAVASAPRRKRAAWPLTKLSIPDIGLETVIVQGMDAAALRRGPGHDINSSAPGEGNCVVAAHRNIYGSFFYRLDELFPGTLINLENRQGQWSYIVDAVYTTPDTNLTILKPPPAGAPPLLTLITCTMPHTSNRIILQAHLSPQ